MNRSFGQPIDNPYKTVYGGEGHWTDSLPWGNPANAVTQFNIIPNDGLDDSASVAAAISTISNSGGGVLFFPAGVYNFSGGLGLKKGVILRGETPVLTAKDSAYFPATRFEFPKYVFDSTANGGNGVANNTAFKRITAFGSEASDLGIVNIDINRAGISIAPTFIMVSNFPTVQPLMKNKNIIVWGVRNNNVASPDPGIPFGEQRPWQRFSHRHSSNISLYASRNLVCANNRINDIAGMGGQDDTYNQPYRLIKGTSGSGTQYIWMDSFTGRFNYTDHYGVNINRKATITYATPETDPAMFAENAEVLDNWVYKTMRVAIRATGLGLVVKGNVLRDRPDKITYIHATGKNEPHGSNTFENRGIDVSGWKVTVENNDLVAYRHRISNGPYYSNDGEGILIQECCGGTSVNDYKFNYNITNGTFISFYKMRDLNNLEIVGNNLSGPLKAGVQSQSQIWVDANTNGAEYYLNNVRIDSNINVHAGIKCTGSKGGYTSRVINNQASSGDIKISCHVKTSNNTGFLSTTILNNGGLPCLDLVYPKVVFLSPSLDTTITDPNVSQYLLRFKVTEGDLNMVKVGIMFGTTFIISNLSPNPIDSMVSYLINLPSGNFVQTYTARISSDNTPEALIGFSNTISIRRLIPIITNRNESKRSPPILTIYPNPSSGKFSILLPNLEDAEIHVFNQLGKEIQHHIVKANSYKKLDIMGLQAGIYLVRYQTKSILLQTRAIAY